MGWARALVKYDKWAASVGRPSASAEDLASAGAADHLAGAFSALLTFPAIQYLVDFSDWTSDDLEEHLATTRAQATAAGWLALAGHLDAGVALNVESSQHLQVAMSAELERRGIRS